MPVLALYSESDGIVGPGIARCRGESRYVTNMAVMASHVGFPFNPLVFAVIANHLGIAPETISSNRVAGTASPDWRS